MSNCVLVKGISKSKFVLKRELESYPPTFISTPISVGNEFIINTYSFYGNEEEGYRLTPVKIDQLPLTVKITQSNRDREFIFTSTGIDIKEGHISGNIDNGRVVPLFILQI